MDNRIQHLENAVARALGLMPDIRIATSVVVAIALVVWMIFLCKRPDVKVRIPKSQQSHGERSAMSDKDSTPKPSVGAIKIKWDRVAIGVVGLAGLLTFVGTGIAVFFGAKTGTIALIGLAVFLATFVGLRALAIRDQKARRAKVEAEPLKSEQTPEPAAPPLTRSTEVFDGRGDDRPADTAAKPQADSADVSVQQVNKPAPKVVPKTVKRVPRPSYLDADEVERAEPEPLDQTEPQPSGNVQLKDGVSEEYQAKVAAQANRRLDLDTILKNRRKAI